MAGIFSLRRPYLITYNSMQFLVWFQVLYLAVKSLKHSSATKSPYATVHKPLLLVQSAAITEILHSLFGIIRSPPIATIPQISSRLYLTWGIFYPQIRSHFLIGPLIISWSITETIRSAYYAVKVAVRYVPWWLVWLRYSTFLVLYPAGCVCEVGLIYAALPYLRRSKPYTWNLSFLALGLYLPGFPHLYGYMLVQRKKALAKAKID